MLYILPPPAASNTPPSWDNILCSSGGNTESSTNDRPPWSTSKKRNLPRVRLRTLRLNKKHDDSAGSVGDETDANRNSKSLSECYFAGKGTALVLPAEAQKSSRQIETQGSNIQKHLQSMFYLLRPEETLKMAVKLESVHSSRTRYLVVVSRLGRRAEESCLLGIDCNEKTTVGLVLRVLADTAITLDGDGGFSVAVCGRHHIFKPVSVQAMWSALQTLHRASSKAREENYFQGGLSHDWVDYYEQRIESDRSCLNEWHAMDDLESRRPPSPDSIRTKPSERAETEKIIRSTLKEIMMSVDLDEVTSKYIRTRLEEELDMDLGEFKSFIDQEMLTILGQMDAPTEIFDHVYLGSEWNASNYEELKRNGVRHILNVTREIDNFFPGTFDYLNIRVYDDEKTDLLKYWDNTFKYITKARKEGSKVLVHCKMGVSRSASVVIAYAMKAYNWNFETAMRHVKDKRNCIKPNTSFVAQLETYQGILDAMKNKEKLQRSKSETNLKSPDDKCERLLPGSQPTPLLQAFSRSLLLQTTMSGQDLNRLGTRPKSWSPDKSSTIELLSGSVNPFRSVENLSNSLVKETLRRYKSVSKVQNERVRNVLLPCDNGESYSVSPNQIRHLPGELQSDSENNITTTVKQIVDEFESQTTVKECRKKLNIAVTAVVDNLDSSCNCLSEEGHPKLAWDPGEKSPSSCNNSTNTACDYKLSDEQKQTMWTSSTVLQNVEARNSAVSFSNINLVPDTLQNKVAYKTKTLRKDSDPFSNQLDRVFDREEKKQQRVSTIAPLPTTEDAPRDCPSRQSSWGSYDSAVVLGFQGEQREAPSRHSSWGSGDTRTLPSRNSSWGSYDMRPSGPVHYLNEKGEKVLYQSSEGIVFDKEDTPSNLGTVKRKKQKVEEKTIEARQDEELASDNPESRFSDDLPSGVISENGGTVETFNLTLISNESSAISPKIDIVDTKRYNLFNSSLSVSAPESSSMDMVPQECSLSRSALNISSCGKNGQQNTVPGFSVKQHKNFIESLAKESLCSKKTSEEDHTTAGIVQNLKKEFEAITNGHNGQSELIDDSTKHKTLPTSPQCVHLEKEQHEPSPTNSDPGEDLSFKKLIGKFEVGTKESQETQVNLRPKLFVTKNQQNKNARFSCIEDKNSVRPTHTPLISSFNTKSKIPTDKSLENQCRRPPVAPVVKNPTPNVVVATVIAKAALKQQQYGKSHPLARINFKPRHNNPVYNTM